MERVEYAPSGATNGTITKQYFDRCKSHGKWRGLDVLVKHGTSSYLANPTLDIYFADEKRRAIFMLNLIRERMKPKDGRRIYSVEMASVDRRYQGFGFGALAYREVMRRTNIIIAGGDTQSSGARKLWAKLNRLSDVAVMAKNQSTPYHEVDSDMEKFEVVSDKYEIYDTNAKLFAFII